MYGKSLAKRSTKFVMNGLLSSVLASSVTLVCEHLHLLITDSSLFEFGCVLGLPYIVFWSLRDDAKVYGFFLPN